MSSQKTQIINKINKIKVNQNQIFTSHFFSSAHFIFKIFDKVSQNKKDKEKITKSVKIDGDNFEISEKIQGK